MICLPELWPHQRRGLDMLQAEARRLRKERGPDMGYGILAQGPTGMGKTRLGLELASNAVVKGGHVLWLAHRNELIDQVVARLAKAGWTSVRVVKAGAITGDPNATITVASIQTLVARNFTPPATLVIFDEARHYAAATWAAIAANYMSTVRVGLDATPGRSDGSDQPLFDVIVPITTVRELTDAGILVPSVVWAPPQYQSQLAGRALDKWLNPSPHADSYEPGKPTIVFCRNAADAEQTAAEFRAAGYAFEAVSYKTPTAKRKTAIDRLRSGELIGLTNCLLFTEGLDVPQLEVVVIERGVSHLSTWIQMGGRPLRGNQPGKHLAHIIDLHGHVHRYGPLDTEHVWSLDGEPVRPVDALPSCVQCRKCHAWGAGGQPCSACGAPLPLPPPPKVKAAALIPVRSKESPERKEASLRRFIESSRSKGHSPRRARHIFKGVYGELPSDAMFRRAMQ